MKHITVKHRYGFFDLEFDRPEDIVTSVIRKRKFLGTDYYLDIYNKHHFVNSVFAETEEYAERLAKRLKEDLKDGVSMSCLI